MDGIIAEILVSTPAISIAGGTDEIQKHHLRARPEDAQGAQDRRGPAIPGGAEERADEVDWGSALRPTLRQQALLGGNPAAAPAAPDRLQQHRWRWLPIAAPAIRLASQPSLAIVRAHSVRRDGRVV
ncbi:MAG: hypothetical protein R3D67_20780 [Hyphomicrobiaceae bacterium]